jgi:hypothetical protein
MISIRSLLRENEFDLSDNPFSSTRRFRGLKRNQCIMYNPERASVDGSEDVLRVVNGTAEEVASRYFDRGVQEQLDKIKNNYLKDPYDFNEEDFLISSEDFKIKKLEVDTYSTKINNEEDDEVGLFFIGYNSYLYEDILDEIDMIDGVLDFTDNNEDDYEDTLYWILENLSNAPIESKTLPDDFFDEYFLELKDKLANG